MKQRTMGDAGWDVRGPGNVRGPRRAAGAALLSLSLAVCASACSGSGSAAQPGPGATLVSIQMEPPGAHCAHGGTAVSWGVDDDGSGVLDPAEVDHVEYRCNPDPVQPPAPHALVRTQVEPPGMHCEHGGTAVLSGLDVDLDGMLDDTEVTETTYVCDTPDSPPRVISRVDRIAAGDACAFGGTAVYSGPDADRDGTLDPEEIERTDFVCDGPTASKEVEVVAGNSHSCARKANGTVWCWGDNFSNQLGLAGFNGAPGPVPVVGVVGAVALGVGGTHTCAIVEEGAVWCWGDNRRQQLGGAGGDGPARHVTGIPPMTAVSGGYGHTCALAVDGAVWCWGDDSLGQAGQGGSSTPVAPAAVPGLADVVAVAAGSGHTCALQRDGSVRCWGQQIGGAVDGEQCNFGDACHRAPTLVVGLPPAIAIASGPGRTCAITERREAQCWGWNFYGALGDDTNTSRPTPAPVVGLQDVREIETGGEHTCAVRGDDSMWCWGSNAFGQLGLGGVGAPQWHPVSGVGNLRLAGLSAGTYHSCALRDGAPQCWGLNRTGEVGAVGRPAPVEVLVDVQDMSAGNHGTCAVVSGGDVFCWGAFDFNEQLGRWDLVPRLKPGLPPARAVAAGATHACIAALDGSVWCWGGNSYGELGDPALGDRDTPVRVAAINDAVAIYAGGFQTCAQRADGSLWCWGAVGELFGAARPPTQMLATVTSVAFGDLHGCAVDADHSAWCWGNNEADQVKFGAPRVAPVTRVLTNVTAVSAGYQQSCAQQLDGSLSCWGDFRTTPHLVAVGDFTAIDGGYWHTCVRRPDTTVACFGMNDYGQLGDGTVDFHSAPVPVVGLDEVVQLSAGYQQTCARRADASLWCWGANDAGQVGDGGLPERVTRPTSIEL